MTAADHRALGDEGAGVREAPVQQVVLDRPAEQAGLVLAAVLRSLLEEQHPDGLDSDDIQAILTRCYRGAAGWLPLDRVEPNVMIAVLASSLGIHEPGVTYVEITAPPQGRAEDWVGDPTGGYVHGGAASRQR